MWRQLDMKDYEAVVALRDAVLENLPDLDMYVREDDEEMFVRGHLNVFGESLGFFDGDHLVADLALTTDLVASREDVEFEACTPTSNDVVFAAAMVLPSYQGRSLHRAGITRHIAIAERLGGPGMLRSSIMSEGCSVGSSSGIPDKRSISSSAPSAKI